MIVRGIRARRIRITFLLIVTSLICCASSSSAASLEKAQAYAQNNLLDEAKKELIDVLYSADANSDTKASALYLLGDVNARQGHVDAATKALSDLVERYPSSAEAQTVRARVAQSNHATTPNETERAAQNAHPPIDGLRLISRGAGPMYPLYYSLDTDEESKIAFKAAMLDSDCPRVPTPEKYEFAYAEMRFAASPLSDSTRDRLHVGARVSMSGSAPNKNGSIEKVGPETFDMSLWMLPNGAVVGELPEEMKNLGGAGSFNSQLPKFAVGVGAQWEVLAPTQMDDYPMDMKATYTVLSIDAASARIRVTMDFKGAFEEGGEGARTEGHGDGVMIWTAGHLIASGSMTASIRLVGTKNGMDVPGQLGCMLFTSETVRAPTTPASHSGAEAQQGGALALIPTQPHEPREAELTLVDRSNLESYWLPAPGTSEVPDIGGIDSPYCIAIGYTIDKSGYAGNPYTLSMHARGVTAGLQAKARKTFEEYVSKLRYVPSGGGNYGDPVFTYRVLGRYSYRSSSSATAKQASESAQSSQCEEAAKDAMTQLRARAK